MTSLKMNTTLLLTVLLLITCVHVAAWPTELCEWEVINGTFVVIHPHSLQCRVCGVETGSAPFRCYAQNATFDGQPIGSHLKNYRQRANFTGLTVAAPSKSDPITPSSHMRYAKTSDNGAASFDFPSRPNDTTDWYGLATLQTFDFACTDTSYTPKPVACTVNLTSSCAIQGENGSIYPVDNWQSYQYNPPAGAATAGMTAGTFVPSGDQFYNELCDRYTYQATMANGMPARLYLDNLLYIAWWNWE